MLLVENLGSEEVAVCDVGGARVAVRGTRPIGLMAGDHVVLTADREDSPVRSRERPRLRWISDRADVAPVVLPETEVAGVR